MFPWTKWYSKDQFIICNSFAFHLCLQIIFLVKKNGEIFMLKKNVQFLDKMVDKKWQNTKCEIYYFILYNSACKFAN